MCKYVHKIKRKFNSSLQHIFYVRNFAIDVLVMHIVHTFFFFKIFVNVGWLRLNRTHRLYKALEPPFLILNAHKIFRFFFCFVNKTTTKSVAGIKLSALVFVGCFCSYFTILRKRNKNYTFHMLRVYVRICCLLVVLFATLLQYDRSNLYLFINKYY